MAQEPVGRAVPSVRHIFLVFLKIGALAFGGVYSMLAFFQRELVDKRGWLAEDEFAEAVSIGQVTPGPPIINTGIFIAYRLRGVKGALAATAGLVLPGFFIVLGLGFVYLRFKGVAVAGPALKSVGAAVVGLLLSVVYKMARSLVRGRTDMLFAVSAFGLFAFIKLNPIALIALSGFFGYVVYGWLAGRAGA
ncbi:MAG TPA: chromate transporter [Nitrospirota bacterium]|jgi:chromate transporter